MSTIAVDPDVLSCSTCAVEHGRRGTVLPETCPICLDDRQYVPAAGQSWATQAEIAASTAVSFTHIGKDQWGITAEGLGIGQTMQVIRTPEGLLLWDPTGLVDSPSVAFIRSLGPVLAIAASHPHMYGAQVSWSHALGKPPVLVNAADQEWVQRRDPVIERWSGSLAVAEGLTLHTIGGHFPGSAIAHWEAGADGAGVVLAGDTIAANPDRESVSFQRSFPNRLPLSAGTVGRIAESMRALRYEQLWSNLGNAIIDDAATTVQSSAERHIAWVRGEFDDLT